MSPGPLPTVPGGFKTILADPPWRFLTWTGRGGVPTRKADEPYQTTATEVLGHLPVAQIAAPDCALFMWTVGSHFKEAIQLGEAWGFEYKACAFVWVKSKLGGWPKIGMGYWTRAQTEQVWLFTRGKPKRLSMGVPQLIHCARGAHSAKPDQTYEGVEALTAGPYLEMFARSQRPGWSAWGNQVGIRDGGLFDE